MTSPKPPVAAVANAAALALGATAALLSSPALAQARSWAATGLGESVTVADCRDCGDDLGMLIRCGGRDRPATVQVPWAASETGEDGAPATIAIDVGGDRHERQGRLEYWGQVGYVPTFPLTAADTLVGALRSARGATIEHAGRRVVIGLRGSRDALDIFETRCGWQAARVPHPPARPASTASGPPAGPESSGAHWFVERYGDAHGGAPGVSLTFGIPETDAVALHARCEAGNPGPFVPIDLLVDIGGTPDGVPVQVSVVTGADETSRHPGTVFVRSSEWAGIRMAIDIDDPLWRRLGSGPQAAFGMDGAPSVRVPTAGARDAIQDFVAACRGTFSG